MITITVRTSSCLLFVLGLVLQTDPVLAQSGSRSTGVASSGPSIQANRAGAAIVAEPRPQGASPFLPKTHRGVQLPVALNGFSVVAIREQQAWLRGSEAHQLVFDGQLYWFASQRERAIFAATPLRYVPALGGDCVVTFADSNERQRGLADFGILHDQRLYFFRGQEELQRFQAEPKKYAKTDLTNDGQCPVSRKDQQRAMPGLPETTVIVNGLRYQFAGEHQQRKFLANMPRYGAQRPKLPQALHDDRTTTEAMPQRMTEDPAKLDKVAEKKSSKKSRSDPAEELKNVAMGGFCPVTIYNQRSWENGDPRFQVTFDNQSYLMAGEIEREEFAKNPNKYIPALGGHCVVSELDTNRLVPGSIYHAVFHEGENRFFLFAGAEQKAAFNANPENYLQVDLVAEGSCIVTLIDEGSTIQGLPELLHWHQGKRYYFASEEQREKFLANIQRYQDR